MENYTKGETREVEMEAAFEVGQDCVDMKVNAGSKIRNLMGYAMNKVKNPSVKRIVWNGSGKAVTKTVTCAEIMKRKIKGLHQINKLRSRRIEEIWEPNVEGLERLKVNRDIPAISILLSKDPLDASTPGYQAPGSFEEFWKSELQPQKPAKKKHKKYYTKKAMDSAKNRNTETQKS